MTILLLIFALSIMGWSVFYIITNKKKLSNENLIEFEKEIKPQFIKYLFISFLPMIINSFYLTTGPSNIKIEYFVCTGVASLALGIFGYLQTKKVINKSINANHFKYMLNHFIFSIIGLLCILAAVVNRLFYPSNF